MLYRALFLFFFNDTATTEIYTLSLHDALPILVFGDSAGAIGYQLVAATPVRPAGDEHHGRAALDGTRSDTDWQGDRKSTRPNSSHANISYAVFCLNTKTTSQKCTTAGHHPQLP